jgi:hypothetical protein
MANGEGQTVKGEWQRANGEGRRANGKGQIVSFLPFAIYRLPFAVYRLPFAVYRSPFTVYRLFFVKITKHIKPLLRTNVYLIATLLNYNFFCDEGNRIYFLFSFLFVFSFGAKHQSFRRFIG